VAQLWDPSWACLPYPGGFGYVFRAAMSSCVGHAGSLVEVPRQVQVQLPTGYLKYASAAAM
jgi:hypothetical protein